MATFFVARVHSARFLEMRDLTPGMRSVTLQFADVLLRIELNAELFDQCVSCASQEIDVLFLVGGHNDSK